MKAFLLAAGFGTRLRPLTDKMPKCLVPVGGRPMLDWWFSLLEKHGVTEVLVNTHYLPQQVSDFISEYNKRGTALHAVEYYEERLLGSGGTVRENLSFVGNDDCFLICYADNLCDTNLSELVRFHLQKGGVLTMSLFRAAHPEQCGIAVLDGDGRISSFTEKPEHPDSDLANAGVYVASRELFDYIPDGESVDFGHQVLPLLIGKMFGVETDGYTIDIGTPENLDKAQRDLERLHI